LNPLLFEKLVHLFADASNSESSCKPIKRTSHGFCLKGFLAAKVLGEVDVYHYRAASLDFGDFIIQVRNAHSRESRAFRNRGLVVV
jgi:hypothetical protein